MNMTKIESDIVEIFNSSENAFLFLSDFNNFEKIMPEQVVNWTSTKNDCRFEIKGMANLGMAYDKKEKPNMIRIKKDGKAPFDFFLT